MAHNTANAIASWHAAESRCFQYFLDALQSITGVTGFTPDDFPRKLAEEQTDMWTFMVNGDSPIAPTTQVEPEARPYGCWAMGAEIRGIFTSREKAQTTAGMALNALPADASDIASIGHISWASMPTVEQHLIEKGDTGLDLRVWLMTLPMWVRFGNSEYEG